MFKCVLKVLKEIVTKKTKMDVLIVVEVFSALCPRGVSSPDQYSMVNLFVCSLFICCATIEPEDSSPTAINVQLNRECYHSSLHM